jgi:hypothetical protein
MHRVVWQYTPRQGDQTLLHMECGCLLRLRYRYQRLLASGDDAMHPPLSAFIHLNEIKISSEGLISNDNKARTSCLYFEFA